MWAIWSRQVHSEWEVDETFSGHVRVCERATEAEEQIQKRLRNAKPELETAKDTTLFDHILVNANLDQAYKELKTLVVLGSLAAPTYCIGTAKHQQNGAKAILTNGCLMLSIKRDNALWVPRGAHCKSKQRMAMRMTRDFLK
uniref:Uncharacterized protein n=1 Tax=Physcomitrium patens TaxID=3218 RepID=A0A2K1KPI2_PHYPA|nr:hypothetical protein PHYPA_006601 [Physcomitrium patens]